MNELKPEDVMRALELHADYTKDNCFECPYIDKLSAFDKNCVIHLVEDALALLREKDAQISALQYQADFWDKHAKVLDETISIQQKEIAEKDEEIERLNGVIETMEDNCMTCDYKIVDRVSTARAEAITEFAERLKKYYDALKSGLVSYHIDQIAKEMREKI